MLHDLFTCVHKNYCHGYKFNAAICRPTLSDSTNLGKAGWRRNMRGKSVEMGEERKLRKVIFEGEIAEWAIIRKEAVTNYINLDFICKSLLD
ncbi:hypothetical protein J6590_060473 [Homalodisca vitripennis]|nr:hypothetical protein J6590_060473 [Homalodisca vitripennis]